jgi:hypothetical protein
MDELIIGDKPIINYGQNFLMMIAFNFHLRNILTKNINIPNKLSDNLDFCYLLGLSLKVTLLVGITITNVDKQITDFLTNDIAKLGNGFKTS